MKVSLSLSACVSLFLSLQMTTILTHKPIPNVYTHTLTCSQAHTHSTWGPSPTHTYTFTQSNPHACTHAREHTHSHQPFFLFVDFHLFFIRFLCRYIPVLFPSEKLTFNWNPFQFLFSLKRRFKREIFIESTYTKRHWTMLWVMAMLGWKKRGRGKERERRKDRKKIDREEDWEREELRKCEWEK